MRLFVSIDFPEELTSEVAAVQEEFADAEGLRFTDPSQTHITLRFLGEVSKERLPKLESALEIAVTESGISPFEVEYGGLGVFPSLEHISVLWVAVRDGMKEMARLHEAIERETTGIGFDPDDHEFTPHATIARMDHAGGKGLVQDLVRERDPTVGRARVEAVTLTKSELTPDRPVHSTVATLPFSGV